MGYTIDIEIDGYTYFCILTPIIDPPPPPRNTPEFPLKTLSSTCASLTHAQMARGYQLAAQ